MAKNLVLVPTQLEMDLLSGSFRKQNEIRLCGFGLVLAGIQTVRWIQALNPSNILLIGIAGSLIEDLDVGSAYSFGSIACYGIGAGSGSEFQTASEMGWNHPVELPLTNHKESRQLVSCTAASANSSEVLHKRIKFPKGAAEDMEGYAVALACSTMNIRLQIARGISNRAGDRDHRDWRVQDAMVAVENLANTLLHL